jgi:hypothetical protein
VLRRLLLILIVACFLACVPGIYADERQPGEGVLDVGIVDMRAIAGEVGRMYQDHFLQADLL